MQQWPPFQQLVDFGDAKPGRPLQLLRSHGFVVHRPCGQGVRVLLSVLWLRHVPELAWQTLVLGRIDVRWL